MGSSGYHPLYPTVAWNCNLPVKGSIFANMIFTTTLYRDEDGAWIAECPAIPGCISQGTIQDEALANIADAIVGCLEVRAEQGMPLMVETRQIEVAVLMRMA